ncbi:HlyD family secretion protein [Teredinibacter purpureus]|uniref:HlyD family secretion protein n=1 Tax=Teredinibacter purpureus TaxID=2731756 RepID=UPI0005F7A213|nr:HlyD family efflux transporter periplasmic adaptor subunit [Teredinibacter purpureus]
MTLGILKGSGQQMDYQNLFRKRFVRNYRRRLYGDVLVSPNKAQKIISLIILCVTVGVVVFACKGTYTKKETVVGWLITAEGSSGIYPKGVGVVTKVYVVEGQYVEKGAQLLEIEEDQFLRGKEDAVQAVQSEYLKQIDALEASIARYTAVSREEEARLTAELAFKKRSLKLLEGQVVTREGILSFAILEVKRQRALRSSNNSSDKQVEGAERAKLEVEAHYQDVVRAVESQKNEISSLESKLRILPTERLNRLAQYESQKGELEQELIVYRGQRSRVTVAPLSGVVSNLQVHEGLQINPASAKPLMTLVSKENELYATLLVPIRAIGMIEELNKVHLRYDPFPYQKFGGFPGEIDSISESPIMPYELIDPPVQVSEPVYLVRVKNIGQEVGMAGVSYKLRAGMTFKADVELEERKIVEWIFEPFFGLKNRL